MVMRRLFLAILLATAACSSAPVQTTGTLPPPLTSTTSTLPEGPGQCGSPLLTDERVPSDQLAVEIVNRFVADRIAGEGAEACLTDAAAQVYASSEFPTCLYSCTDLAALDLPDPSDIRSEGEETLGPVRSILVDYHIDDTLVRTMREVYGVQTVRGPGDERQVLIGNVTVEPESYVDDVAGRQTIDDFLAALTDGAWDVAYTLMVNEGASSEVERRLPDLWSASAPADVLEPFCKTAMCGAAHEILDSEPTSTLTRTYHVRFSGGDGPVTVEIPVDMFEGQLSIGQLPPDGTSGDVAPPLRDLFFPEGYEGPLAFVRYDSIQLDDWYVWHAARYERNAEVISDSVAFDGIGGVELAQLGDGVVGSPSVIAAGGWTLAGVALDDGEPSVLVTDGRRIIAYRLSDESLRTIVEGSTNETITCASTGHGNVLVTKVLANSTIYDLYSSADGEQIAHFEPDKAAGCGVLAPDGSKFVYSADVSLHNPQTIVLASAVDGSEIDRWSVLAEALIGSSTHPALVFDGRYAIADLMVPLDEAPYVQNPDLGRRFVVDTQTGDQWTVDTSAQALFPPG